MKSAGNASVVQFTMHKGKVQRVTQDTGLKLDKAKQMAKDYASESGETGVYVVYVTGIPVTRWPKNRRAWEKSPRR